VREDLLAAVVPMQEFGPDEMGQDFYEPGTTLRSTKRGSAGTGASAKDAGDRLRRWASARSYWASGVDLVLAAVRVDMRPHRQGAGASAKA
jgi:hypothetical protein